MDCCKCQKVIDDDSLFCRFCGGKQEISCPNCSKIMLPDSLFCSACGTKLQGEILESFVSLTDAVAEKAEETTEEIAMTPKEKIAAYEKENGKIFSFIVNGLDRIIITRYNDSPERDYVKIPDFVYGFGQEPGVFSNASHLKKIDLGTGLRSLSYMFYECDIESLDLSDWDVSNITDMSFMFLESELKNVGNLDAWNVSNVTNMRCMFCQSVMQSVGDLSQWNTENVETFGAMFAHSEIFTIGDVSAWHVENLEISAQMFDHSEMSDVGDITKWHTPKLDYADDMFRDSQLLLKEVEGENCIFHIESRIK